MMTVLPGLLYRFVDTVVTLQDFLQVVASSACAIPVIQQWGVSPFYP